MVAFVNDNQGFDLPAEYPLFLNNEAGRKKPDDRLLTENIRTR